MHQHMRKSIHRRDGVQAVPLCVQWLILFFICSCVGTVETSKKEETKFEVTTAESFSFSGISETRAISHDKIEIDFYAPGGAIEYAYYLYVNESNTPIDLKLDSIPQMDGGVYRYTLKGLQINQAYTLKIRAKKIKTGAMSKNENIAKDVRTFDNRTANFAGVARVTLVPGQSFTSAKIEWNPAQFNGPLFATAYDPVYYTVTYISAAGGPANLNNSAYSGTDKFSVKVPAAGSITPSNHPTSVTVTNLQPSTKYYFQVRATQKVYNDFYNIDPNNIPVDREQNTIYVTVTTDGTTSLVDFNKSSLLLENSPADDAFTKIRAYWAQGTGAYVGYRLFVKQYTGIDLMNDDQILKADVSSSSTVLLTCQDIPTGSGLMTVNLQPDAISDPNKIDCFDFATDVTNVQIANLTAYTGYHVKVALCRSTACPMEDADPLVGILSDVKAIITQPKLAPFNGINFVYHPQDASNLDHIKATFNAPVVTEGYADTLEVYCVDPSNHNNYVKFPDDGNDISTVSPGVVPRCDDLSVGLTDGVSDLSAVNSFGTIGSASEILIKGVKQIPDPDANYCFAITPAITQVAAAPADVRMAAADWVVRCIAPEVQVPTVDQFPGIVGSCTTAQDTASIAWAAPTGGIYQNYEVFYKLKDNTPFNFNDAISGDPSYTRVAGITTTTHTESSLNPGTSYEFGVLSVAISGPDKFYSEPNLKIVRCDIPMPKATFGEWTRVFAIGPKIDGRIPPINYPADSNPWPTFRNTGVDDSRIYEGLSEDGIPYEVDITNASTFTSPPPGDTVVAFNPTSDLSFDGVLGNSNFAASREGIISLAWKNVTLDFKNTEFANEQVNGALDHANARNARNYGYKVYRSSDNGVTWTNMTGSRLIHSRDYTFKRVSNGSNVTERMAFFTDFSVRYAENYRDIERARVYKYKIVPVYNDVELVYTGTGFSPPHIITVTLPPANMALVHRYMANRTMCTEVGKHAGMDKANYYRCDYNGLGTRPKGFPWQLGESALDLGGDLLVDRFELGCNFTRGKKTIAGGDYALDDSFYDDPGNTSLVKTELYDFQGRANNGNYFRGCTSHPFGNMSGVLNTSYVANPADPYSAVDPTYKKVLVGDCMGDNILPSLPASYDSNPFDANNPNQYSFTFPGARDTAPPGGYDFSVLDANEPQFASDYLTWPGLLGGDFQRYLITQSEFAAVYYNRQKAGSVLSPRGPGYNAATDTGANIIYSSTSGGDNSCSINLASIGNDGTTWRARWFPFNQPYEVKNNTEVGSLAASRDYIMDKTLNEAISSKGLYDDWRATKYFSAPDSSFWNTDRIHGDMKLARIATSNSAKLPPFTGLPRDQMGMICDTYQVQVGISNNSGSFQAFGAPTTKRISRRSDHILAAAFPENFTEATITSLESSVGAPAINGKNGMTCNSNKTLNSAAISEEISANRDYNLEYPGYGATNVVMTGSSDLDNDNNNTENCTSRFGVQDIVGNSQEWGSDVLYCDYRTQNMAIYFGEYNAGVGVQSTSLILPNTMVNSIYFTGAGTYIKEDAVIRFEGVMVPPDGSWTLYDGNSDTIMDGVERAGNTIWHYSSADAGYCSIVDSDDGRVDTTSYFVDITTGVFNDVLNPDGTVNGTMITEPRAIDQPGVDTLRNGDGRFMNFGDTNLGPRMRYTNALSFDSYIVSATERMEGVYFSPIAGLPLTCDNYGVLDSCGVDADDNKEITLQNFWINFPLTAPAAPTEPQITNNDFPVGNSKSVSDGIDEVTGSSVPVSVTVDNTSSHRIATILTRKPDGTVEVTETMNLSLLGGPTNVNVFQMTWNVLRGANLDMISGGSYGDTGSGRYSLKTSTNITAGGRCFVLINQDQ